MPPRTPRPLGTLLLLSLAAAAPGCAVVQPWDRGLLASPAMTESPFAESSLMGEYRDKTVQVQTGGGLGGVAPGGGCGCTR